MTSSVTSNVGNILVGLGTISTAVIYYDMSRFTIALEKHNALNDRLKDMTQIKNALHDLLYGKKHRAVSECQSFLMSRFQEGDITEADKLVKARKWYADEYLPIQQNNKLSMEDRRNQPALQVNACRSQVRDNFVRLSSLLEEYNTAFNRAKELGYKDGMKLLTVGQANEISRRYDRFYDVVKHFDLVMGYEIGESTIYNKDAFKRKLRNSVPESKRGEKDQPNSDHESKYVEEKLNF